MRIRHSSIRFAGLALATCLILAMAPAAAVAAAHTWTRQPGVPGNDSADGVAAEAAERIHLAGYRFISSIDGMALRLRSDGTSRRLASPGPPRPGSRPRR